MSYVYSTGEKAYIGNKSDTKPPGQSGDILVEIDKDLDVRKVYKYDGSSWILKNTVDNHGSINDDVQGTSELDGVYVQLGEIPKQMIKKRNTIVIIGDSLTANNGKGDYEETENSGGISYHYFSAGGWLSWANVLNGHKLTMTKNLGVGGERTDQIILRLSSLDNYISDFCHVLAGTNDIGQDISPTTIIQNLETIYNYVLKLGMGLIIGTIPPRSTMTSLQLSSTNTVNNWIKKYANTHTGVICVDYHSVIVDVYTGLAKSNTLVDGVHLANYGAYLCGKKFKSSTDSVLSNMIWTPKINSDSDNIATNGLFTGDNAGLATSWTLLGTATPSKVASTDDDINDYWQQVVATSGNPFVILQNPSSSKYAVGDNVYCVCEFDLSNLTEYKKVWLEIYCMNGGTSLMYIYDLFVTGANEQTVNNITSMCGILKTPIFQIPTGTNSIQFRMRGEGAGTFKFRRAGMFKV